MGQHRHPRRAHRRPLRHVRRRPCVDLRGDAPRQHRARRSHRARRLYRADDDRHAGSESIARDSDCGADFKSGLTGQSAKELTDAYVTATRRPWTQPIGFQHALFEVAIDVLKRAKTLEPEAILAAVVATDYKSIVGPAKWTGQPVRNVTQTPLVAGQ